MSPRFIFKKLLSHFRANSYCAITLLCYFSTISKRKIPDNGLPNKTVIRFGRLHFGSYL